MTAPLRLGFVALVALTALGGCGQLLGIDDLQGPPDGRGPFDALPDVPIGPAIRITGTVRTDLSGMPMPTGGLSIDFFRLPQDFLAATTIATSSGSYSLDVPTDGMPLDGYVRASDFSGGLNATFHYVPQPLTAATTLDLEMLSGPFLSQIANAYGQNHDPSAAAVFVKVIGPDGRPLVGVPIQVIPTFLRVNYNSSNGTPSPGQTTTGPDGLGLVFNVPPGVAISASATLMGQTFGPVTTQKADPQSCHFLTLRAGNGAPTMP